MILKALVGLAEREGLTGNLDFQPVPVRWLVTVNEEGKLVGDIADLQRPPEGRGKPVVPARSVPNRSKRTSGVSAEFVVDKAGYAFGLVKEGAAGDGKAEARAREQYGVYKKEVALAAERTGDVALQALARFLEGPLPAPPAGMQESDLVAFSLVSDVDQLITDRPAVARYWAVRRLEAECGSGEAPAPGAAGEGGAAAPGRFGCLVTGAMCEPVRLHPKIKGIPPASDTKGGVQLTSVNASAFVSYGLDEIGCAPVSQGAADSYEKALNWLLANERRSARLSHNSVVVFWAEGADEVVDLLSDAITGGNPEAIGALYGSPWKGRQVRLDEQDTRGLYSLTLSGAIGRGTVRSWSEVPLGRALKNVGDYFEDLRVVRPAADEGRPRPLLGQLRQMAVQGELENIAPNLASELFSAILAGRPFPRAVLDQTLRRVRAERTLYADRASLIKAYLCRARRAGDETIPEVKPMLDEKCETHGYVLGRLFAVLEKVQEDAIGAKASIRDRFYGAASATPVVVFPQLTRKLPHHLGKLPDGAVTFFEKLIQQIMGGLRPPQPFPRTLSLEEQGLFAVGYYHQRQALFTKREKAPGEETTSN